MITDQTGTSLSALAGGVAGRCTVAVVVLALGLGVGVARLGVAVGVGVGVLGSVGRMAEVIGPVGFSVGSSVLVPVASGLVGVCVGSVGSSVALWEAAVGPPSPGVGACADAGSPEPSAISRASPPSTVARPAEIVPSRRTTAGPVSRVRVFTGPIEHQCHDGSGVP
ncbi:hypothetical protein GCM10022236_32260 [Microlunatus ginsengisoli]|uniref:Uncharacterized protein n=1 Tax=Microlunatus ginsengisoli TaxID=363863 RepID=A0ABP7A9E0_9ACTN